MAPNDVGSIDETSKPPEPPLFPLVELPATFGEVGGDDGNGDDESVSTDESTTLLTTLTADDVVVIMLDVVALVNEMALRKTDDGEESESPSKNLLLKEM